MKSILSLAFLASFGLSAIAAAAPGPTQAPVQAPKAAAPAQAPMQAPMQAPKAGAMQAPTQAPLKSAQATGGYRAYSYEPAMGMSAPRYSSGVYSRRTGGHSYQNVTNKTLGRVN